MFDNLVRAAKTVLVYGICLAWLTGIIVCFTEESLVGILILIFGSIGAVVLAAVLSSGWGRFSGIRKRGSGCRRKR